jgi:NAD(P)-dependent dehydrogenase (short-subunit alcohol dehydrogenase family)
MKRGEDMNAHRFSGQVAIVTGSTADPSIGRACAFRLAREGASVVVNGRDDERVTSTVAALRSEGHSVAGVTGSMDTESAVAVLADRAVDAFGRSISSSAHSAVRPSLSRSTPSANRNCSRRCI